MRIPPVRFLPGCDRDGLAAPTFPEPATSG